jgi:outer membrane biogenesis lipoprotein LolB
MTYAKLLSLSAALLLSACTAATDAAEPPTAPASAVGDAVAVEAGDYATEGQIDFGLDLYRKLGAWNGLWWRAA